MRVACWTIPELDPLDAALRAHGHEVYRADPHACRLALVQGDADLALVTTVDVLLEPNVYRLLPGTGLTSLAAYPYTTLQLRNGLERIREIGFDPRARQDVLLARLLLKEHYLTTPQFVPLMPDTSAATLASLDGILVSGPRDPGSSFEPALSLDLGREWYELTTRPMVWGLFAALPDRIGPGEAQDVRQLILRTSAAGDALADETEAASVMRTRLDEFALQGMEELATYLFYVGTLDEIADLRFVPLPEPDAASDEMDDDG